MMKVTNIYQHEILKTCAWYNKTWLDVENNPEELLDIYKKQQKDFLQNQIHFRKKRNG